MEAVVVEWLNDPFGGDLDRLNAVLQRSPLAHPTLRYGEQPAGFNSVYRKPKAGPGKSSTASRASVLPSRNASINQQEDDQICIQSAGTF